MNAGTGIATGTAYSLAGAPAGDAANATEQGIASSLPFAPIAAFHGEMARQGIEKAPLAKQSAVRGMVEFGNNPELDASTGRGIAKLSQEQQQAIFEQRGIYRELKNSEGKQIQIHVPDDYAQRATAANGGTLSDAANSRGFYLDGQGGVFINPEAADTLGSLQEALGHELGHSTYQDALPAVNTRAATRLQNAVADAALDGNLQPKPDFQQFINNYATAANGKSLVDWNSLPVSGDGLTRNYLLKEYGAEHVRAATPDVGSQLSGPYLTERLSNLGGRIGPALCLNHAPQSLSGA